MMADKLQPSHQQRRSNTRGFTLIELVVSLMIAVLVIGAAGALIISSFNLVGHQVNRAEQETIVDNTAKFVKDQLLFAQSVEIVYGSTVPEVAADKALLYIGDEVGAKDQGYLYYRRAGTTNAVNAFGETFYKRCKLKLDYSVKVEKRVSAESTEELSKPKVFEITVTVFIDNSAGYSTTATFQLLNSGIQDSPLTSDFTTGPFYLVFSES